MSYTPDYVQLSHSDIFAGLSPGEIHCIFPCISHTIKSYDKGQVVFAKGEHVGSIGLVLEGSIALVTSRSNDKYNEIATINKNQLFCESLIFSTGKEVENEIIAKKDSVLLFLEKDFFIQTCNRECPNAKSHGEVMKNLLRILSDRTVSLNRKVSYLTAPDLKTKLAMYLYDLHQSLGLINFNMPLNRDQLASYLSVARPSLSREFINLRNMGIIDFNRSNVEILDLAQLYTLAHPNE